MIKAFFDKLHFKFLQMPLFDKEAHELESHFDKWLYFLKHLDSFDHIPAILNEPIFQKAFEIAELANLSREQYHAYEQNLLDYWGVKAAVNTARAEGHAEGHAAGRAEGRVEGGAAVLLRQLARRFGPLPDWVAPRLATATPAQLAQWADRLLEAESLEAMFNGR